MNFVSILNWGYYDSSCAGFRLIFELMAKNLFDQDCEFLIDFSFEIRKLIS